MVIKPEEAMALTPEDEMQFALEQTIDKELKDVFKHMDFKEACEHMGKGMAKKVVCNLPEGMGPESRCQLATKYANAGWTIHLKIPNEHTNSGIYRLAVGIF